MVPTKEEEAKLTDHKGKMSELGSAEKLVKAMLEVPFAFSRIEAMLYRETFQDEILHLRKSFSMLEEACKELRSSRLFLKLLEAVLKTGNRMNVGTIRGGAKAFKLDALLKLADIKGKDGKTTLLHFVVREIVRSEGLRASESIMGKIHFTGPCKEEESFVELMGLDLVSGLSAELSNAKKTATIDLDVLASSVENLTDGMKQVRDLVRNLEGCKKTGGGEGFVGSMWRFLIRAEDELRGVRDDEARVFSRVREITEYFHGDVSRDETNPLRIFVIVRDFLSLLDNVCKEHHKAFWVLIVGFGFVWAVHQVLPKLTSAILGIDSWIGFAAVHQVLPMLTSAIAARIQHDRPTAAFGP
ncbi:formin-like protein [Striga asiatica]|uniref:Formin-like protein n=1 Tax=Striga asiatica TaxID=4170 RepID=A0A5A7PSS1_STRAF|nr:formin-like protein [Striga asiatica]